MHLGPRWPTGGHAQSSPWRFTKKETGYDTSFPDSGYARVRVTPQEMRVEFVTLEGNVLPISFSVPPRKK